MTASLATLTKYVDYPRAYDNVWHAALIIQL